MSVFKQKALVRENANQGPPRRRRRRWRFPEIGVGLLIAIMMILPGIASANSKPVFESGSINGTNEWITINSGDEVTFKTIWSDADGDSIIAVRVKYCKKGAPNECDSIMLPHITHIEHKVVFGKSVRIFSEPGVYDYHFFAVDAKPLKNPLHHESELNWYKGGTFGIRFSSSPKLLEPAQNAQNVSTTPKFKWEGIRGADSYRIVVAEPSVLERVINNQEATNLCDRFLSCETKAIGSLSYEKFTLEPETQYCWSVRAGVDGKSNLSKVPHSYWSEKRCFTTAKIEPEVPEAPDDVDATDGDYSNYVKITWDTVDNADRYEIWRGTSSNQTAKDKEKLATESDNSYLDKKADKCQQYYYFVKSVNSQGKSSDFSHPDKGSLKIVSDECRENVTLTVEISGDGEVTTSYKQECSNNRCNYDYKEGNSVTLIAKESPAKTIFKTWQGDYCNGEKSKTCSIKKHARG